jgi:hypothetical protein
VAEIGVTGKDWYTWHDGYDTPGSTLARRLDAVQERIRAALDGYPPGPVRVVSLCAGQGRDLLTVLADHPRRADVSARLVELDPRNAQIAREYARDAGLTGVEVVIADAGRTDAYAGSVPAHLVLVCGVFGNIPDAEIRSTVYACAQLCATGGIVLWTRHRRPPDLVPEVCRWFAECGFVLEWLSAPDEPFGLGAHRFTGTPAPLLSGSRIFSFTR